MQNANSLSHLDPERLAALDQDAPTTDELAHLASCAVCRAERQAHLALASLANAERMPDERRAPRLTNWESLASQLRAEGLLTSPVEPAATDDVPLVVRSLTTAEAVVSPRSTHTTTAATSVPPRVMPMWLRAAAAVVLLLGGGMLGRLSSGVPLGMAGVSMPPASDNRNLLASDSDAFASVQQASEILYRAQRDYERASLWLASNDTTVHSSDVYRTRLAALDQMMASSRAALRDAPSDPILNHYFQSASTAREATLKQLSIALPLDKTLERY